MVQRGEVACPAHPRLAAGASQKDSNSNVWVWPAAALLLPWILSGWHLDLWWACLDSLLAYLLVLGERWERVPPALSAVQPKSAGRQPRACHSSLSAVDTVGTSRWVACCIGRRCGACKMAGTGGLCCASCRAPGTRNNMAGRPPLFPAWNMCAMGAC